MAFSRGRFALAALCTTLSFASIAHAEPTPAEKETARGLMSDGRDRREKGDVKGALKSFIAADAIMRVPTTGYEVAVTQGELGMLVEARDTLLRVLRIPEPQNEPAPFREARQKAQAMSDALAPRIPTLTISVGGAAPGTSPTVTIDSTPIPAAAIGVPFRVNPGHHVLAAKTEGMSGSQEVDVAEREAKTVEIPLGASAEPVEKPVAAEDKPPVDEAPTPEAPPPSRGLPTLTWIGFGVAAAGVVAGSVTGLMSLSSTSSAQNGCRNNQCPPSTWNDIDSASTMATVSTVSFIVAGVGVGVGVVGLLTRPKAAPAQPTQGKMQVTPWLGLGSAGVRGSF